jgi:hypothetical protein
MALKFTPEQEGLLFVLIGERPLRAEGAMGSVRRQRLLARMS